MCAALGALEELCRSTPTRVPMRALPVCVVVSVLLSQVYLVCRLTRPESELLDLNCERFFHPRYIFLVCKLCVGAFDSW